MTGLDETYPGVATGTTVGLAGSGAEKPFCRLAFAAATLWAVR
jgi:hypothetical protein